MTFDHVTAVVTAVASLGALYFAFRTVREARAAGREARRDNRARHLERAVDLVSQIRLAIRGGPNRERAAEGQGRLRPVLAALVALGDDLPLTRQLAAMEVGDYNFAEAETVASDALVELAQAAAFPLE